MTYAYIALVSTPIVAALVVARAGNVRLALGLFAVALVMALVMGLWLLLRPLGGYAAYRLKPPDERDLIDFDKELKQRTRNL